MLLRICAWALPSTPKISSNWYFSVFFLFFQEASRSSSATAPVSPDEGEEAESPMPAQLQPPVRRRGAISAEPITEEDVASYVKKVRHTKRNRIDGVRIGPILRETFMKKTI